MKISDLLSMCVRNLLRRKFRTFLTVTGVTIGTCAIVVMISLGVGLSIAQEEWLGTMGDLTIIDVRNRGSSGELALDDEAIAIMQAFPGVEAVTPLAEYWPDTGGMQLFAGKKEKYSHWYGSPIGIYPEAMEALDYELGEGDYFKPGAKKIQLVFGSYAAYEFYNTKNYDSVDYYEAKQTGKELPDPYFDPWETPIFLKFYYWDGGRGSEELVFECEVVGILSEDNPDWQAESRIFMHLDDMKYIQSEYEKAFKIKKDKDKKEEYDQVKVKALTIQDVEEIQATIDSMGFYTFSLEHIRKQMEESAQQTQMILGLLGCVSLFVAAISITNTMIMSVYERTREIGVMKVLGCLVSNIRSIFLIEAALIGFFGGLLGIAVSYLLSFLLNRFGGMLGQFLGNYPVLEGASISVIPPWLVLLGMAFATLIGIVSGFLPANRAVKISALEAIKTE